MGEGIYWNAPLPVYYTGKDEPFDPGANTNAISWASALQIQDAIIRLIFPAGGMNAADPKKTAQPKRIQRQTQELLALSKHGDIKIDRPEDHQRPG